MSALKGRLIKTHYDVFICALLYCRCAVSDTAEYSAVAVNPYGTATSKATVIVKSKSPSSSPTFRLCSGFGLSSLFLFPHRAIRSQGVLPPWTRSVEGLVRGRGLFYVFAWTWAQMQPQIAGHVRGLINNGKYCDKLSSSSRYKSWSRTSSSVIIETESPSLKAH